LEENDDEQVTIGDLVSRMQEYMPNSEYEPYSSVYMKTKLQEHFGDKIIVTELNGKHNVVTFRTTCKSILHDFYNQTRHTDIENEKLRFIQAAAELIKSDIKSLDIVN